MCTAALGYDPLTDFAPLTRVASNPLVLAVHPGVPVSSTAELIQLAKERPGLLNYGSPGNGTPPHMAGELFKRMAGIEVAHVPYKGGAPALTDLVAGRLTYTIEGPAIQLPQVKAGRLRALAVTSRERVAALPEVPTVGGVGRARLRVRRHGRASRRRRPRRKPSSRSCTPTSAASCARPNRASTSPAMARKRAARARGVRRLHSRRAREVGEGRARGRDQGGVEGVSASPAAPATGGTEVDAPHAHRLLHLINASWTTQAIYAAVELAPSRSARRRSAANGVARGAERQPS